MGAGSPAVRTIAARHDLTQRERVVLLAGGRLNRTKDNAAASLLAATKTPRPDRSRPGGRETRQRDRGPELSPRANPAC